MDFSYEKNGKVQTFSINTNDKWNSKSCDCEYLNTIFQNLDDGDNVVSQLELDTINRVFKSNDSNDDGIVQEGELTIYFDKSSLEKLKAKVNVAEMLYDDIFAKNSIGFPTTGKNIERHLQFVNKDNIVDVLAVYQDKTEGKESLVSGILSEYGLDINTRLNYVRHIFNQLKEYCKENGIYTDDLSKSFELELKKQRDSWTPASAKNIDRIFKQLLKRPAERPETKHGNIAPNGKIDADFSQGYIGDCWLLASIKAIANSPKGLKILNDSIKVNGDQSVTVTLKGVDKKYTFSKNEIERSSHLSTGDLDVRVIEMAVNKYITEEGPLHDDEVDIDGNHGRYAFKILTGKTVPHFFPLSSNGDHIAHPERYGKSEITDEMIDNFNKPNHIATVSATSQKSNKVMNTPNGDKITLKINHAYAVIRADSRYVYLVNPHDSSKEIPVDRITFKQFFNKLDEFDL